MASSLGDESMEQEPAARRWNRSLGPVMQPGPPRPSETEENEHTRNHHPNHCEGLSANSPIGCPLIPFSARTGSTRFSQGSVTFCYSFLDSCKFSRPAGHTTRHRHRACACHWEVPCSAQALRAVCQLRKLSRQRHLLTHCICLSKRGNLPF